MDRRLFPFACRIAVLVTVAFALTACGNHEQRKTAYLDRGMALFEAGDDARARLELKNVLQIDAKFAPGWYWLGRVEEREGNLAQAFGDYNRAVELEPAHLAARIRRGQFYVLGNDLEKATADAGEALRLAPGDADALMLRSALRRRQGDAAGAEQDAQAALAVRPGHPTASAAIAAAHVERGDRAGAIALLQQAVTANPGMASLPILLARYHHESGQVDDAVAVLAALVAAHPDDPGHRIRYAAYLSQLGRMDAAEQVLRDALAGAPDDGDRQRALVELVGRTRGADAALAEVAVLRKADPDSLSLRFLEAELMRSSDRRGPAEQAYREIIATTGGRGPDAIRARNTLAAMLATERAEEAAVLLGEVLAESPTEPDALQLRAAMALRDGRHDEAIVDLRTVLREHPERVAAQRAIGQAHAAKGEAALAQDAFDTAIRKAPADPAAYLMLAELQARGGDAEGALATLERLLEKVPDNAAAQQAIAQIQMSQQDWQALVQSAGRIKSNRPQHPLGYYLEGLALQRQERHAEAVAAFESALALRPDAPEPLVAMARSQLAMGAPAEAERWVRRVLADNPNSLVALNLLGDIYRATGQAGLAMAKFEEAVRFHPKAPRAYLRLAQLQQAQGDTAAARRTLELGVAQTGRSGYLVLQLAMLLEAAGEYDAAIAQYEEVVQRYPRALAAANNLSLLLARHSADPAALDRALELAAALGETGVPAFLDTLGWVHYLRGEATAALPYLEQAVTGDPESAEFRHHLGMTYLKLGRRAEAQAHLLFAAGAQDYFERDAAQRALAQSADAG